jgi:hypothetical protein
MRKSLKKPKTKTPERARPKAKRKNLLKKETNETDGISEKTVQSLVWGKSRHRLRGEITQFSFSVKGENMDNLEMSSFSNPDLDKPIPFDNSNPGESGVSHAPLDLGGSPAVQIPSAPTSAPKPAAKPTPSPAAAAKPAPAAAPAGRIEGVRTFFTKLHPGAINFLDETITRWLKENPEITVKRTNITVGEIQAKKTEPNILVTVWY